MPPIDDIKDYNRELLVRCAYQEDKLHYSKRVRQGDLLDKDSSALLALPSKQFLAIRYELVVANGYGHVSVDESHTYSSAPEYAHTELIVAVGAHTVSISTKTGEVIASHRRSFGKGKTETIDALSQFRLLLRRPRGFRNSKIREQIPANVISYLDALDTDSLRRDLKLLYDACERSGIEATFDALDVLSAEHEDFPDFFQVGVLAARIADLGIDCNIESGANLDIYDEMFLGRGSDE